MFMLCYKLTQEEFFKLNLSNKIAETKFDGRRVLIEKKDDRVFLYGTDEIDSKKYRDVIESISKMSGNFKIDTEFVVIKDGVSKFELLQSRDKVKDTFKIKLLEKLYPITVAAFDIIEKDGRDLTKLPWKDRHNILESLHLTSNVFIPNVSYEPLKLWEEAVKKGEEGIILKDINSEYLEKRSDKWLKVKRIKRHILKAVSYEINNKGITITTDNDLRCQVAGNRSVEVKTEIDKNKYCMVEVNGLMEITDNNKIRQITFNKIVR